MTDVANELAVQSFCFRNFKDNAECAAKVRECGLSAIELCGIHVDWSKPAGFADIIATYRDAGVEIVSIGVNRFADNEDAERNYFEFVRQCGAKHISCDFALDAVPAACRTAEKLADEYDVKLGIHNHGGHHWLGNSQMLGRVFSETSERIGLCIDTAWALHANQDPVAMCERFADRLYGVHLKDFTFDRAGNHEDVVVGTGNLDVVALRDVLKKIGFDGLAILEYEGDVEHPVPAISKCVDAIREKMSG